MARSWCLPKEPPSPIRALHGLTEAHVMRLAELAEKSCPGWSLQRHESYDGTLIVLLIPPEGTRIACSTIVIYRDAGGFQLGEVDMDRWYKLDTVQTLDDVVAIIQQVEAR